MLALAGCATPGPGAKPAPGQSRSITGAATKTFGLPMARVKSASVGALSQMRMRIDALSRSGRNELVRAASTGRSVEIELEPLGPAETRMRVAAKSGGLLYDADLGSEVIRRTERELGS